jgi:hypothetical protein
MATVSGPKFDGGVSLSRTQDGDVLEYSLHVTGLSSTGIDAIAEAMTAAGVPSLGGAVVGDTGGNFSTLKLSSIVPEFMEAPDAIRLKLTYSGDSSQESGGGGSGSVLDGRRVSFGATLQEVQSNTDYNGNVVKVTYQGVASNNVEVQQAGTFSATIAQSSISVSIRKNENPVTDSNNFVNTFNDDAVLLKGQEFKRGELLCTSITGETNDNEETWDTTYQFLYAPPRALTPTTPIGSPWERAQVYYVDPDTGKPPPDIGTTGILAVQIREGTAFSMMGIWDTSFPPA